MKERINRANYSGRAKGWYVTPDYGPYYPVIKTSQLVNLGDGDELWLPGAWEPATQWHHNELMYDAATIIQRALRGFNDGTTYTINGAYIEFDNSGSPVDPVPTVGRDEGLSYYNSMSAPRDFLRVGITATAEFNSDEDTFTEPNGATFVIQTAGTVGFQNALDFSDSAGSIVYGMALVCIRDTGDQSRDIVFNRMYLPPDEQLEKLLGKQVALTMKTQFE